MTRIRLLSALMLALASSCKVAQKDITGLYKLDQYPKTTLQLNADKTFTFFRNTDNPYLHPLDHPGDDFLITKGTWQSVDKKTISLTSQSDTLTYPLVTFQTSPASYKNRSHFTFKDVYGDTVKILYVQYTDSTIAAWMHRSMDDFTEDLTRRDTLEFHFYGYRPYTLINGQHINQDYQFVLQPVFQPRFFTEAMFSVKREQLIDVKRKAKFRRTKSGR